MGSNGKDVRTGRFLPGNPGGPGNPQIRRLQELKRKLANAVEPDVIAGILRKMAMMALEGNTTAAQIVLDRMLGKAVQPLMFDENPGGVDAFREVVKEIMARPKVAAAIAESEFEKRTS